MIPRTPERGGGWDWLLPGLKSPVVKDAPKGAKDPPREPGKFVSENLTGKWEITKGSLPPGTTVELARAGKIRLSGPVTIDGTYRVEGDKFTFTLNVGGTDVMETFTITKLTDTEFEGTDKDGKIMSFKKVK